MYFVYLINSIYKKWVYVGFSENVVKRLSEHNSGKVKSTSNNKPFELLFVQVVDSVKLARKLEKFLKVRYNKESLLELL